MREVVNADYKVAESRADAPGFAITKTEKKYRRRVAGDLTARFRVNWMTAMGAPQATPGGAQDLRRNGLITRMAYCFASGKDLCSATILQPANSTH